MGEELDQRTNEIYAGIAANHMAELIVASFVQGATQFPEVLVRARQTGTLYAICRAVTGLPPLTPEAPATQLVASPQS